RPNVKGFFGSISIGGAPTRSRRCFRKEVVFAGPIAIFLVFGFSGVGALPSLTVAPAESALRFRTKRTRRQPSQISAERGFSWPHLGQSTRRFSQIAQRGVTRSLSTSPSRVPTKSDFPSGAKARASARWLLGSTVLANARAFATSQTRTT